MKSDDKQHKIIHSNEEESSQLGGESERSLRIHPEEDLNDKVGNELIESE